MQTALFNKTSKAFAWVAAVSLALMALVPSASAFENLGTFRYQWVAQSGTVSADGKAHEVAANAGDTVAMSLTIRNRSTNPKALVMYGKSALLAEAGMPNAHAVGLGTSHPRDVVHSWIDASSFQINGNRFAYYDGAPVNPGETLTLSFNLKIAANAANGTYDLYTELVREWDGWAEQVDAAGRAIGSGDIFWRVKVGGTVTPPTATGSVMASLAAGTPAAASLAFNNAANSGANANFTKFTLTPVGGAAGITSIYVTRDGLSTDSELENVKIIRASDGVQVGGTAGGFDANHRAQVFFSPALTITSATDFFIRAGVDDDNATANHNARLGIAANTDIVGPATVSGAPFWGNAMTFIDLVIGTVTVAEFGSMTDSTPDVGDTNVNLNQFSVQAGSVEDVWLEQISVLKSGSAESGDISNIELWNDTTASTVATVGSWDANNRAVFNFSPALKIAKGQTVRFTVRADIIDGSGLTVNADLIDGTDALVVVKGDLYGYYITPTISGGWTGVGDSNQTINAGALTISKSTSTIPTGNVSVAADQNLGSWDFDARGESMRITSFNVTLGDPGAGSDQADITNARIVDALGNIVAGPVDGDTTGTNLNFSSTFIVPVGVNKYTLRANLGTDLDANDTIIASIAAAGDVTVKGVTTNSTITPTVSGATLNTQTVKAGALISTTLATPAARSITPNIQDYVWATASLSATTSGEDVLVTATQWGIVTNAGADAADIVNMEVWADLTAASSSRGDAFETKVSNATQSSDDSDDGGEDIDQTITLSQTLTIAKGTFVNIAFVGDLAATSDATDTYTVNLDTDASDVTAIGKDTGTAITTAPTGAGQLMTVVAAGTLTFTTDSSSPLASVAVGNTSMVKAGVFRIAANNVENIELDEIIFEPALTAADVVNKWWVYSNRDANGNVVAGNGVLLGTSSSTSATAFTITIADGVSTVPANNNALITVYADVSPVDGVSVINGDDVQIGINGGGADDEIDGTGKSSGAAALITAYADLDAATHEVMKSKLTVSVASTTPSGALVPSSLGNIAEFNFTADAAADISFRSASDDSLVVQVDVTAAAVDANADTVEIRRKATGVVLDSDAATHTFAASSATYETTFNFSTNALTVAAGTTEVVQVFVETTDLAATGESVRAWIDDTAADITHGTEGGDNEVALGAIIARGDIYANVLSKP